MSKGRETRERILAIAEESVLAKGFGATSIEEIISEAGLTKSGFFYHFRDKNELARAMLERYVTANDKVFAELFGRGCELSDDPLQAFLIGLKLLAETLADLPNGHPGCLIASVCYQERLFDREVREITARSVNAWNLFFQVRLEEIAQCHPPAEPVDIAHLAQMMSCITDGGIIMSKVLRDPGILPQQVLLFRSYVKLLFAGTPAVRPALLAG
ncbi:TetR/AcrR family transcriptional regulator [Pelagibacterium xiamenense]|uniref:TetR/AcrR family transcriptional regulator n=1 Tax=Pelagibacterium xiamenense TaxID=2901140 RepID=UPI001E4EA9C7|nr:TetR/AcrR family transcriptional regulator [Pelagibacterium xiamenense]MCD7058296.1 TetR/AcrR family transcriptional regulator [Pelagibacterium xiamenense]